MTNRSGLCRQCNVNGCILHANLGFYGFIEPLSAGIDNKVKEHMLMQPNSTHSNLVINLLQWYDETLPYKFRFRYDALPGCVTDYIEAHGRKVCPKKMKTKCDSHIK